MHAAVVASSGALPRYAEFPDPVAAEGSVVAEVVAAGLHPLVRSRASGAHYSSDGVFPLVPGVDGVVRMPDGSLRYAILHDTRVGTMAELALVDPERSIPLPDGVDPVAVAAAMNPAMSSWVALRSRIAFEPGGSVLVIGATGNAGRMAVQIARILGASRVIGAGRDAASLESVRALGADEVLPLDRLAGAADVDVVLDYVWGPVAGAAMTDVITARPDRSRPLDWVQIGSVAGPDAPVPGAALRASRLRIVGSGIGSVSAREFTRQLPALVEEISAGRLDVRARAVPLADVEAEWTRPAAPGERVVLVP